MLTSPTFHTLWYEIVGSTSSVAAEMLGKSGSGTVIAAELQTNGRGQGDHRWFSAKGENLTFSILLEYDADHCLNASEQQLLSMATSLAVVDFLNGEGIDASIKLPNDVYVGNNKICGMLIENGIRGRLLDWSIIGIGININQTEFPEELPNPVSMRTLTGKAYEKTKCLSEFLRHFVTRFDAIWTRPEALRIEFREKLLQIIP